MKPRAASIPRAGQAAVAGRSGRGSLLFALAVAISTAAASGAQAPPAWRQWGGPYGDFRAPAGELATRWPEAGPAQLWSRALGAGYSAILVEGDRLYTMYRTGGNEVVVCLEAGTGEMIWEHRYEKAPHDGHVSAYGSGPGSTPLLAGDRLFTVGVAGTMHALNKHDGALLWSRELWGEQFKGNVLAHGYSSSPVAYRDTVIVPVGGDGAALVAFDQRDGSVRWKALSFRNSYSSPRIVNVAGETEIVVFMAEELIGVNPDSGELRWRFPHENQWKHNITMPSIVDGDTVVLSSPQAGARGLKVKRNGGAVAVEEIWSTRRIQFFHGATVSEGDWVYGSSGMVAVAFMAAINARTGEIGWREGGFARANCVEADGHLLILDENGALSLASATPGKLVVHATAQLLGRPAWTVPTIVGTTMYARDNERILAVSLGESGVP
ncbi:MAG TPA: PQQ-binding-like beta-propeller repeat protein [Candidatus Polarisedimenticolia bacterium]|nr:PQQ-binding-like beta-propeller repeat protein [Candidatus Polarisedimenticolia bacterium]